MMKVLVRRHFPGSDADIWAVIGDPAAIERWNPGVREVVLDGPLRRCRLGTHQVVERIVEVDPVRRRLCYEHVDGPVPFQLYRSTLTVRAGTVQWGAEIALADESALAPTAATVRRLYERALDALGDLLAETNSGLSIHPKPGTVS